MCSFFSTTSSACGHKWSQPQSFFFFFQLTPFLTLALSYTFHPPPLHSSCVFVFYSSCTLHLLLVNCFTTTTTLFRISTCIGSGIFPPVSVNYQKGIKTSTAQTKTCKTQRCPNSDSALQDSVIQGCAELLNISQIAVYNSLKMGSTILEILHL